MARTQNTKYCVDTLRAVSSSVIAARSLRKRKEETLPRNIILYRCVSRCSVPIPVPIAHRPGEVTRPPSWQPHTLREGVAMTNSPIAYRPLGMRLLPCRSAGKGRSNPGILRPWLRCISHPGRESTFESALADKEGEQAVRRSCAGVLVCRDARVAATAYRDIAFSRVGVRKHTLLIQRTVRARRRGQLLDASSVHRQGATRTRRQRLPSEGGLRKVQRGGAGHPRFLDGRKVGGHCAHSVCASNRMAHGLRADCLRGL